MTSTRDSGSSDFRAENDNFSSQSAPAQPHARPSGKLLRRAEAARLLGVSKSTLRRMEGTELQPKLGPRNVRMFLEEEVRAVIVTRRGGVDVGTDAGDLAAEAFTLFDAGLGVIEAVKQLRAAPEAIESLHARWVRLRGALLLSAEGRSTICETMQGWDEGKLKTEADVIAFLKKWITQESLRSCWECKGEFACFCRACAKQWGLREARGELADMRARKL